jgi:DNA-binding XRE family transcriptional regulator
MELGWSQEQLGEEAGLHRTYIGKLERGEIDLSFTRAVRIAWALGCKLSELYEE